MLPMVTVVLNMIMFTREPGELKNSLRGIKRYALKSSENVLADLKII